MRILDFLVKERKRRTVVGFSFNINDNSVFLEIAICVNNDFHKNKVFELRKKFLS